MILMPNSFDNRSKFCPNHYQIFPFATFQITICSNDWKFFYFCLAFAAPTIEYIQKDFESADGFFCDNRDTYVLHANDDGR